MTRLSSLKAAAFLVSALSSASVAAQAVVTYPDPESITFGEVPDDTIIVSGIPQPRTALPVSVASISADDLARRQTFAIADALSAIPGVSATRNGPVGAFTGVRIRGADAAQTLVIIDGVRVGDPTAPSGGFDFGSLLAGSIRQVDVQRGSNSVIWGSDAIGGVVLVETGGQSGLSADYGSHQTANVNARLNADIGPARLSLGGGWFDTDGISAARVGTEADGFRQNRGNARLSINLTEALELSSSILFADSHLDIDGFAPPSFSFGDTAEFQESQEIYASASIRHRIGDRFAHSLRVTLADINRDTFNPALGSAPDFMARGRSDRLSWHGEYGRGADSISLIVGADREWNRSLTASSFSADRGRTATTGIYGHANLRPVQGVLIGLGARHDDHRQFGGDTSLSAHGLFEAAAGLSLRASYSEGYKAPTLFQLSGTAGGFGNPALRPEESRAYDIGVSFVRSQAMIGQWAVGIRVDASLFRRDSRSLIDFVSCAGASAPPICAGGTRPFGTYANIDRARAEGGEIEIRLMPATAISVTAGYAYTATRDRTTGQFGSGNRLARRPVHSAIFAIDYDGDRFALGAEVRLVGDSFDDAGNFTRLDGFALASVRGSVHLTRHIDLFARIENLFDADYQTVSGYGTYGRTGSVGVRVRL